MTIENTAIGQGYYLVLLESARFPLAEEAAARAKLAELAAASPGAIFDLTQNRNKNGLWQVWILSSRHLQEREAQQNAGNLELEDPSRVTRIFHDYDEDVENTDVPLDFNKGEPVELEIVADCGACIRLEGTIKATALLDVGHVTLSVRRKVVP